MAKSVNQLLSHPEFNRALDLLNRQIRILVDGRRELIADITAVEPFSHLAHARYTKPFENGYDRAADDKPERKAGSLFTLYPQGQPTLSVVDDAEKQSIVVIKEVGVHNARMPLQRLLTDKAHGNMKPDNMRKLIRELDGVLPASAEILDILARQPRSSSEYSREEREGFTNSLGIIRRK